MKKLALFAIALGSLAAACAPPSNVINITPSSNNEGGGGEGGETNQGGFGGQGAGGGNQGGGGEMVIVDAHYVYVNEVHPAVAAVCTACHNLDNGVGAPAFFDYDAEVSYSLTRDYPGVVAMPGSSILETKGAHDGPALSETQKAVVQKWLAMEMQEANGGAGGTGGGTTTTSTETMPSGQTLEGMLEGFANCMDYDVWDASNMDLFPTQQTNGEGPCLSCHNTGVGALWLSSDPLVTFDKNKTFPYVMRLVSPVYQGSTPVDLAPSTRIFNKGTEPCGNPPICHPQYSLTPQNQQALEDFVTNTLAKWDSGNGACAQP